MLLLTSVAAGCAAKRVETIETGRAEAKAATPPTKADEISPQRQATVEDAAPSLDPGPLYYELDSARLTSESMATLAAVADWMRVHRGATIRLSGHTCELGTSEYNLALGQRRAQVARDYLIRLGVPDRAISTISFGEEHPSVQGEGESSWAKNRRAEFDVSSAEQR